MQRLSSYISYRDSTSAISQPPKLRTTSERFSSQQNNQTLVSRTCRQRCRSSNYLRHRSLRRRRYRWCWVCCGSSLSSCSPCSRCLEPVAPESCDLQKTPVANTSPNIQRWADITTRTVGAWANENIAPISRYMYMRTCMVL